MGILRERATSQLKHLTTYHWVMLIISILAIILGFSVSGYWFILLFLPLILTPIARETGLVGDGDAKIEYVAYQGSYIAFYLMLLIITARLVNLLVKNKGEFPETDVIFLLLFIAPLLYKFLSTLSLSYGGKTVGLFLGFVVGLILLIASLVGIARNGITPEFVISILVIVLCFASVYVGKLGGGLLALVGTGYFVTIFDRWQELGGAFWLALLIGSPLILAGLLIYFHRRIELE